MYAMQIQTGELRETDLPNGYGEWSDYAKFAVTFAPRDRDLCSEAASDAFARWRRTGGSAWTSWSTGAASSAARSVTCWPTTCGNGRPAWTT